MARGRKTGGRKLGTPNKATVERAVLAERAAAEGRATGRPLAKEVLDDFMHIFAEMAASFRELGELDNFQRWALHAIECAKALAPYQSPKLSAVMVGAAVLDKIEVTGGLPDDQDGGLIDTAAAALEHASSSTPDLAKANVEGSR